MDVGAEAVLARRPEGLELIDAAGLTAERIDPADDVGAASGRRAACDPIPAGTVMGVPGDVDAARRSGVFSPATLDRIAAEEERTPHEPVTEDVAVGRLVGAAARGRGRRPARRSAARRRLRRAGRTGCRCGPRSRPWPGRSPAAGRCWSPRASPRTPSASAADSATRDRRRGAAGLHFGARRARPHSGRRGRARRPFTVRTSTAVRAIRRSATGFVLSIGPRPDGVEVAVDAVVIAAPAAKAAALLRDVAPSAAAELATHRHGQRGHRLDRRADGRPRAAVRAAACSSRPGAPSLVKGVTISSQKWPGAPAGLAFIRASIGRFGDEVVLQRDDAELAARAVADLGVLLRHRRCTRSTCWSPGGAARCRSTTWATSSGSSASVVRRRGARAWRSPARATTASAFPPASPADARRPARRPASAPGASTDAEADRAGRALTGVPAAAARRWQVRRRTIGAMVDGKQARELNDVIRYTAWSVFRVQTPLGDVDRDKLAAEVDALFADLAAGDLTVRGVYDVAALRADADLMVWWHAETVEQVQDAYERFRRTELGTHLVPVWSQVALHRPAEFNKSHVPAFLADEQPGDYVCVYPFVRSYEWYLLEDAERRALLAEHGQMARGYPDVRANTVSSFALGDYEWMLAFEANELHRIVDLMRHLRGSGARRHVREEVPFYTGRRRAVDRHRRRAARSRSPGRSEARVTAPGLLPSSTRPRRTRAACTCAAFTRAHA